MIRKERMKNFEEHKNVLVSFVCSGTQKPSPDLIKAIDSYNRLKDSFCVLSDNDKLRFVGDYGHGLGLLFSTKIKYIKRLALRENIQLRVIDSVN